MEKHGLLKKYFWAGNGFYPLSLHLSNCGGWFHINLAQGRISRKEIALVEKISHKIGLLASLQSIFLISS